MVKRCCYGTCNSDTRYPERQTNGITFIPFPKPTTNLEKCKRWIRLCGRPHEQLNLKILNDRSKAKHLNVCTKHFVDGQPSPGNPDPRPATVYDTLTPTRRPPKPRSWSEPPKTKARTVLMETFSADRMEENEIVVCPPVHINEEETNTHGIIHPVESDHVGSNSNDENRSLEMLALAAENDTLKRQVAKLILENEDLLRKNATENAKNELKLSDKTVFSSEKLRENSKKDELIYYTGLNKEQFSAFLKFLVPVKELFELSKKLKCFERIPMEDQLLMVMMKLRQNFDFNHLGRLFGISQQDASTLF